MSQVFQFAVIGLGAGSLYAIAAIGLVLVFRGSRVVNFAQGAMGMMAAYVFYELHQNWHLSVVLAIPAGLLVSGALGAAFYYFEIRQLKDASNLIKIVATLALFVIAQEVINLVFGAQPRTVNSSLPTNSVTILGASIGEDRLWIFGIVIVLTVVLWAIYKYTTFGLATTAVAENPTAAATLAISPDVVAAANWFIGAALGGLAAILVGPDHHPQRGESQPHRDPHPGGGSDRRLLLLPDHDHRRSGARRRPERSHPLRLDARMGHRRAVHRGDPHPVLPGTPRRRPRRVLRQTAVGRLGQNGARIC